jgi:hypothetical protein
MRNGYERDGKEGLEEYKNEEEGLCSLAWADCSSIASGRCLRIFLTNANGIGPARAFAIAATAAAAIASPGAAFPPAADGCGPLAEADAFAAAIAPACLDGAADEVRYPATTAAMAEEVVPAPTTFPDPATAPAFAGVPAPAAVKAPAAVPTPAAGIPWLPCTLPSLPTPPTGVSTKRDA